MIRILLPLAVVAAILFGPMYTVDIFNPVTNEQTASPQSGMTLVQPTIDCWMKKTYSFGGDCAPKGEMKGKVVLASVVAAGVAAVLGVFGLLPFVGRLTSVITTLAGAVVVAGIGYFAVSLMSGGDEAKEAVQWGTYLAGGGGLLTLISGLSGMRGR
jgi:ribose/xylose/arabinose/galactoside ABC-type transport system permease subunit